MAGGMVVVAFLVLLFNGQVPARVPADAPAHKLSDLVDALRAVDGKGQVDLAELKKRHASLETFVASLAAMSPDVAPESFPTVEGRLAYWLNAYHSLALLELLDTRETKASSFREAFDAAPIGGRRWPEWRDRPSAPGRPAPPWPA